MPIPSLYIFKEGGDYHVVLNQEDIPPLKVSSTYNKSLQERSFKTEEKKYFQEKINSANWFIHSLQQRQERLKRIAYILIHYQRDFLEKGPDHLKTLKMQDLAKEMSVHVSTISRIVNNKYAYTPRGLLSLRSFFERGVRTYKTALSVPAPVIKQAIKKWIEEERIENPISDDQICKKILKHFHIPLLRRSVADYRNSLGFPSSQKKKKTFFIHSPENVYKFSLKGIKLKKT